MPAGLVTIKEPDRRSIVGTQTNTNKPLVEIVTSPTNYSGLQASATIYPSYAAAYTPLFADASIWVFAGALGQLTGNITINLPTTVIAPQVGDKMTFRFAQDTTGGRTVTWNGGYIGATLTGSGTANQKAWVEFTYTGTEWRQTYSSGWYS